MTDFQQGLDTEENWLINKVISYQLKYLGYTKRHSGFSKDDMLLGNGDKGRSSRRWRQYAKHALDFKMHEVAKVSKFESCLSRL